MLFTAVWKDGISDSTIEDRTSKGRQYFPGLPNPFQMVKHQFTTLTKKQNTSLKEFIKTAGRQWHTPLIPANRRQRQVQLRLQEPVPGQPGLLQRNPVSKQPNKQKTKKNNNKKNKNNS